MKMKNIAQVGLVMAAALAFTGCSSNNGGGELGNNIGGGWSGYDYTGDGINDTDGSGYRSYGYGQGNMYGNTYGKGGNYDNSNDYRYGSSYETGVNGYGTYENGYGAYSDGYNGNYSGNYGNGSWMPYNNYNDVNGITSSNDLTAD